MWPWPLIYVGLHTKMVYFSVFNYQIGEELALKLNQSNPKLSMSLWRLKTKKIVGNIKLWVVFTFDVSPTQATIGFYYITKFEHDKQTNRSLHIPSFLREKYQHWVTATIQWHFMVVTTLKRSMIFHVFIISAIKK